MYSLKKIAQFSLNRCPQMNMYNVTNNILTRYTKYDGVSYWFDKETAEKFLLLNQVDFGDTAKQLAGNDIYSMEVFRGMWSEFLELKFDNKNNLLEDYENPFRLFHQGENKKDIIDFFDITFKIKDKFK